MFKTIRKVGHMLGLVFLAACTVALAADNHSLLTPGASNEFDLPNGGHVVEASWSGFNIMGDVSDSLHMSNNDCHGITESDGGTWGVFAGTGKYEGATGGGTWDSGKQWPDGKADNNWRGEINLK